MARIDNNDLDIPNLANLIRASLQSQCVTATLASGSAISLTTATTANLTSMTLPPGTYLVWATADFNLTAASTTVQEVGISLTSATLPSQAGGSGLGPDPLAINRIPLTTVTGVLNDIVAPTTLVLTATTTVYLVVQATFSAGTITAYGTMVAQPQ